MRNDIQSSKSRLGVLFLLIFLLLVKPAYAAVTIPTTPEALSNTSLAFLCCSFNFLYVVSLAVIPVVVIGFILINLYKSEVRRQQEQKSPLTVLYTGLLAGGGIILALRIIFDTLEQFGVPVYTYIDFFYNNPTALGGSGSSFAGLIEDFIRTHLTCCAYVPNSENIFNVQAFVLGTAVLVGHTAILLSTIGSMVGFAWKGFSEAMRAVRYEEDWREGIYRFGTYAVFGFAVSFFLIYLLQVIDVNAPEIARYWILKMFP